MPTLPKQLTFQLRVELDDVAPTIWRQILVPTSARMSRLHDMIQATMGWTNSHLHTFVVGDTRYGPCFDDYPEGEVDEQTVTVLQAIREVQQFTYEYDFGDRWRHTITVEAEFPSTHALKFGLCLAGENACPPEDSGGPADSSISLRRWRTPNTKSMRITCAGTTATLSTAQPSV
jgi:Plasmid pRiA4b ORF-3-like protein